LEAVLDRFGVATRTNYEVIAPRIVHLNVNGRNAALPAGMSNQFPVYGDAYNDHPAARALRARAGLSTTFSSTTYLEVDEKPPEGADPQVVCTAPERQDS